MRNGDFAPTRHESQQDAANLVVGAKMQQNPESSVGVLTMASTGRGAGARVLVSPTDDMGNILNSLHNASVGGQLNFVEGVQVAQLALKHRRNKNGAQRIAWTTHVAPLTGANDCAATASCVGAFGSFLRKMPGFVG